MNKNQSWQVVDEHRTVVAQLLDGLDDRGWSTPSLCAGWSVRDVGAHLSLAATAPMREIVEHAWAARGSFDRMIDLATRERGRRAPEVVVADLLHIRGSRHLAPGTLWRDPLLDVLVHSLDVARPLGIDLELPVDAAREAAEWAWRRRFPFHPARRLRGARLVATDTDWARGAPRDDSAQVRGPMASLLMLSTGRTVALADLEGPGLGRLTAALLKPSH